MRSKQEIQESIRTSQEAIRTARELITDCENRLAELRLSERRISDLERNREYRKPKPPTRR